MKWALVTGSSGFVGRHIYRRLVRDGWIVDTVDIKNGHDCRETVFKSDKRYDLVIHCAAVVGGRMMIDRQPMSVASDLAIDSDFFQFVRRTRPAKAVYFSSSAAYPISLQGPVGHDRLTETDIDLDNPEMPDAVYGWVKLTGEQVARYADAGVHIFRPFSGYGGDQDLDYPFPSFIERAVEKVKEFHVWGSGEQVRDWVHIDDVVAAVFAALDRPAFTTNICTGVGVPFLELARTVMRLAGHDAPILTQPDKPQGVMYRVGDPSWMREWGFKPRVSLEEGIDRALYYRRGLR